MKSVDLTVNVPTQEPVNIEEEKEVTITSNGTTTITPSQGYDAIGQVKTTVAVPDPPMQERSTNLTMLGVTTLTPTNGYIGMSRVVVDSRTLYYSNYPYSINFEASFYTEEGDSDDILISSFSHTTEETTVYVSPGHQLIYINTGPYTYGREYCFFTVPKTYNDPLTVPIPSNADYYYTNWYRDYDECNIKNKNNEIIYSLTNNLVNFVVPYQNTLYVRDLAIKYDLSYVRYESTTRYPINRNTFTYYSASLFVTIPKYRALFWVYKSGTDFVINFRVNGSTSDSGQTIPTSQCPGYYLVIPSIVSAIETKLYIENSAQKPIITLTDGSTNDAGSVYFNIS